ncbi:hypothetical protein HAX54_011322 [Datura stramonium]|uniref:Uncharacterized protein n=1 Tax=Datura stramonium TaxID=4076 RepID=A0ABS8THR3_DATST|nr:hypothetical protein [Datura stramonium]
MKGKSVCKVSLQQHLGLQEKTSSVLVDFTLVEDLPAKVGCIFSDISDIEQENLNTFILKASRRGVQFVFMGSGQTPGLNMSLEYFEEELKVYSFFYQGIFAPHPAFYVYCVLVLSVVAKLFVRSSLTRIKKVGSQKLLGSGKVCTKVAVCLARPMDPNVGRVMFVLCYYEESSVAAGAPYASLCMCSPEVL